ncbi:MAG: 7-cyano-7-deazaguanine synthase QueC [Syntrophomonadaceae bacterium]|jgi:7-cyano-7-deazaguanine synthase
MGSKALVLLSGGLDSTTCLALAVNSLGADNVITLSLLYGQKHQCEVKAAQNISAYFGCKHILLEFPNIFTGYGSTLIDPERQHPEISYQEISNSFEVSPTYVPFRNGNLLSAATALALGEKADCIYYGAHAEDSQGFAYPDCTPEFNGAMANAIYIGTYHKVRLLTPLQWLSKKEVVELAQKMNSPIHMTYSCYTGREQHCGKCPTCISRIAAFKKAGFKDPVEYELAINWEE